MPDQDAPATTVPLAMVIAKDVKSFQVDVEEDWTQESYYGYCEEETSTRLSLKKNQ